jgi:hypothetical protein
MRGVSLSTTAVALAVLAQVAIMLPRDESARQPG